MKHIREEDTQVLLWWTRHFLGQKQNVSRQLTASRSVMETLNALPEPTEDQRQLLVRLRDRIYSEAQPEPPEKPAVVIELDNIIQIDHQQNGHQQQN
jgi:hypothetical protein